MFLWGHAKYLFSKNAKIVTQNFKSVLYSCPYIIVRTILGALYKNNSLGGTTKRLLSEPSTWSGERQQRVRDWEHNCGNESYVHTWIASL
jgi:hypothetical protein